MRNIILFIGIVMSFSNLYSQNIIDPPALPINFNNTNVFERNWAQNNFVLGWNWGSPGRVLDVALNINYYHTGYGNTNFGSTWNDNQFSLTDASLFKNDIKQIMQLPGLTSGYGNNAIFNVQALTVSPTLNPDSTDNFIPRPFDSSGDVFGFFFKRIVRVLDSSQHSDMNYDFALLDKDSIGITPDTVFKNMWDGSVIYLMNYAYNHLDSNIDMNGTRFYFTINLKSFESIPDSLLDDVILKIRLPYLLNNNNLGYIKFDSLASESIDSMANVDTLFNQDRGQYKKLYRTNQQNKPTEFNITGEMLKYSSANPSSTLTLSGFFVCDGTDNDYNPFLHGEYDDSGHPEYITNLDIEVLYYGKIDLGIRYFRIECPRAQAIFRGFYDNLVKREMDTLIKFIDGNNNGVRIHRIYGNDEVTPRGYSAMRYYNKLLDDMVSLETFTWVTWGLGHQKNHPRQYLHATDINEFFCGSTINLFSDISVPYVKYGKVNLANNNSVYPNTFNYRAGYGGYVFGNNPPEGRYFTHTLNSEYETWLAGPRDTSFPFLDYFAYDSVWSATCTNFNSFYSTQSYIEFQLYHSHYKNRSLIFSDKPWWANLWITPSGVRDATIGSFTFGSDRPKTGEEVRYIIDNSIILGTKGLLIWFKTSASPSNQNFTTGFPLGLQTNSTTPPNLTGENLIYSDLIGGDFVDTNDDPNGFDTVFVQNAYDWQTLDISNNRIYKGLKSARSEIYKINKWIDANNDVLIDLRLKSWFAKGFLQWNIQSPGLPENYLSNFISLDPADWNFRRPDPLSPTNEWRVEGWDSAFYDVTLLKDVNTSTDTVFFIGIQSRRSDPLIYSRDTISFTVFDEESGMTNDSYTSAGMRFYTTAEFDNNVRNGGDLYFVPPDDTTETENGNIITSYNRHRDTSYWKNLWNKRLGTREISIPFDFKSTNDSNDYCLLKITELGHDLYNPLIPDQWWWLAPEYHHTIDTTIGQDRNLTVRLLPGEGKILKVEVLRPDTAQGYLEHSNQSKLIAHAVLDTNGYETDTIQYHLVYYKPKFPNNDTNAVFYRRSHPIFKYSSEENIVWEDEIRISRSIDTYCDSKIHTIDTTMSCDHPSIVVRNDGGNLKAYVVYQCQYNNTINPFEYIAETIIDLNSSSDIDTSDIESSHLIGRFHPNYQNWANWGNPVINASANGNYYAWSDSLVDDDYGDNPSGGIMVGYRDINNSDYCLDTLRIMWRDSIVSQHPSLNVYSSTGDDKSSLVWQEKKLSFPSNSQIYHTQLEYSNNNLQHDDIRQLSKLNFKESFPVIHRVKLNPPFSNLIFETIFWQSYTSNSFISYTIMFRKDSVFVFSPKYLKSNSGNLFQPNISQGPISSDFFFFNDPVSLNFSYNDNIYLFGFEPSLNVQNNAYFLDKDFKINYIAEGMQSHQAINQIRPNDLDSWKNRRVFNTNLGTPPYINTSAKYFYRTGTDNDIISERYAGFSNEFYNYFVGIARMNDVVLPWILPYKEIVDTVDGSYYEQFDTDSILTTNFNVAPFTTANVDFIFYGSNATSTTIGLEGHPSNTFISLPIPPLTPPASAMLMQYTFLNMLDANYRLVFINGDNTANYTEQLIVGGLPVIDTIFAKNGEKSRGRVIIDLNTGQSVKLTEVGKMQIKAYPNPANDAVFITVNYPVSYILEKSDRLNKAKIRIFSINGDVVWEGLATQGETIKVPTDKCSQGMYFIQAEENITDWQLDYLAPTVERLMIER